MLVIAGSVKIIWPPTPIKCLSEPSQQISSGVKGEILLSSLCFAIKV